MGRWRSRPEGAGAGAEEGGEKISSRYAWERNHLKKRVHLDETTEEGTFCIRKFPGLVDARGVAFCGKRAEMPSLDFTGLLEEGVAERWGALRAWRLQLFQLLLPGWPWRQAASASQSPKSLIFGSPEDWTSTAEMNSACGKVLLAQNAWVRRLAWRAGKRITAVPVPAATGWPWRQTAFASRRGGSG